MKIDRQYDVIVLGGGAGGVAAAVRAAQLGGRVAVIENKFPGGLCMNRGCVPFGHMLAASGILANLEFGKEMGIDCPGVEIDFAALLDRQNRLIAFMRQGVQGILKKHRVELIKGTGRIKASGKIEVEGAIFSFNKIILASGGRWVEPEVSGAGIAEVVNSDHLLSSESLPGSCLVLGHGPHSIEIAQLLKRFGCNVHIATRENGLFPDENKTIRTRLSKEIKSCGIPVHTKTWIEGLERTREGISIRSTGKGSGKIPPVDLVVGCSRAPALQGLGLENIGLDPEADFISVNERMETAVPGVYAIGDLTALENRHFSHLASSGGITAAENAMGKLTAFNPRLVVRIAYTSPAVACVGLTLRQAEEAGFDVATGAAPLSMNPRGMILSQNNGLVEIVADKKYGEILG
ncbi:MAG TPA: NAD(P)/FAD-dependent oxidoreductase, partial [Desulfobacteraceae bacterium]|nr:NAD(P)/FAD-dependent oxidoreductase [Desulfobacteraceae bacterium]